MLQYTKGITSTVLGLCVYLSISSSSGAIAAASPEYSQASNIPDTSTTKLVSKSEPRLTLKPARSTVRSLPTPFAQKQPRSILATEWGKISVSTTRITRGVIRISLTQNHRSKVIYSFKEKHGAKLQTWGIDGSFLLLNFGETGPTQPDTGDYGEYCAVVDLSSGNTLYAGDVGIETSSFASLTNNYLVIRAFNVGGPGYSDVFNDYNIINLTEHEETSLKFVNSDPFGNRPYIKQNHIYYTAQKPTKGVYEVSIPNRAWGPLTAVETYRIVLQSPSTR